MTFIKVRSLRYVDPKLSKHAAGTCTEKRSFLAFSPSLLQFSILPFSFLSISDAIIVFRMLSPAWAYRHISLNDSLGDIVGLCP